ncbi:hypothetical protein GCM10028818_33350 [Spirosoma horti]
MFCRRRKPNRWQRAALARTKAGGGKASHPAKFPGLRTQSPPPLATIIRDKTPIREKTPAELLKELATPKVFEGPDVDVQRLSDTLDKMIDQKPEKDRSKYNSSCVGGIVLTEMDEGDSVYDLISKASLVKLESNAVKNSSYDLVQKAGIENDIIINTLATMEKAGQLEYLQKSGVINENWKIIIEVHYTKVRFQTTTNLHKDTIGQTLFVNLNYVNDKEISGPEYIVNPASSEKYEAHIARNLPTEFIRDLRRAKELLPIPTEFGATRIPKYGVVAFVDEAIHHKTPSVEHRTIEPTKIVEVYADINKAYIDYNKQKWGLWPFITFLAHKYRSRSNEWYKIFQKINRSPTDKFTRAELVKVLPERQIDLLIGGGPRFEEEFDSASIPEYQEIDKTKSRVPVKRPGQPALKRQMSRDLLKGSLPKRMAKDEHRKFFRTWVRAVPRREADLSNRTLPSEHKSI